VLRLEHVGPAFGSADGSPGGVAGGTGLSANGVPRAIGPGLRPSSTLIAFSWNTMRRSRSGTSACVWASAACARATCNLLPTPPSKRRVKRSSVSWKDAVVSRAISSSRSSSSSAR
jgi:hypothetical protein